MGFCRSLTFLKCNDCHLDGLLRVALQIARTRELLNWFGTFYTMAAAGMLTGFQRSRKPGVLVPLLPLTFILGYQIDMAYGNKLKRIKRK